MKWSGRLMASFQMMGSVHFSLKLDGYPDTGVTNEFLESLKGKTVKITVEELST